MQPRKTEREAQILRMLSNGLSPRRVGKQVGLSETRVRYIRERAAYERTEHEQWVMLVPGNPFFTVR